MGQQRFDLYVRALGGPTSGQEHCGKGVANVVDIGKEPPPGGIRIPLRSLAPVHVRVQLQDGQAVVTPVGTSPVRVAPHGNVDWERVDPLQQPAWWNEGGVIYLGRPGSGVALELVRVEALGAWEGQRTTTSRAPTSPVRVKPSRLPMLFLGCGILGVGAALAVAGGIVVYAIRPGVEVLPRPGEVVYEYAEPETSKLVKDKSALRGMEGGWDRLVVRPSARLAEDQGQDMSRRRERADWDEAAFLHFVASAERHAGSIDFYRRVDAVRDAYAKVLTQVDEADMPEALAAIPLTESRYQGSVQSHVCALGWWQLMPETARRVGVRVEDCALDKVNGERISWTPSGLVPPRDAPYIDRTGGELACRIAGPCGTDERTDLRRSTEGSLRALGDAWNDPELGASGSGVVLTILSHNAGYLDRQFGVKRPTNIRPAYLRWRAGRDASEWHRFYGDNITCAGAERVLDDTCGGELIGQTQHYAYTVVAQHLVAMCYLGRNYPDEPAFIDWVDLARDEDGPCGHFRVPSPSELR